eukprot:scaffold286523_cov37-Prasinocladus_malaysianus.AAC.1
MEPGQRARRLSSRGLQANVLGLEVLQMWLGKLLELPEAPTVEECLDAKVLVAAVHRVVSSTPLVAKSYAEFLGLSEPKEATMAKLEQELCSAEI